MAFSAWIQKLRRAAPPGQLDVYLAVGVCNTLSGYGAYALLVWWWRDAFPLYYMAASAASMVLSVTQAYILYKIFVFKTHGHYVREYLRCWAVYGGTFALTLVLLPGAVWLCGRILNGRWPDFAPYAGGLLVMGLNALAGFFGHKYFSFRPGKERKRR